MLHTNHPTDPNRTATHLLFGTVVLCPLQFVPLQTQTVQLLHGCRTVISPTGTKKD